MVDHKGRNQEVLAFLVLDKDDRLEKYLNRTILPLMEKLLKKFITQYTGSKITEISQFRSFKQTLDKAFGTGTLTLEEKVISLLG